MRSEWRLQRHNISTETLNLYGERGKRTQTLLNRNCKCVQKGDEKVVYVQDLALQGKRKQVKVTDLVATTAATASQIWKRKETEESAAC